MIDLKKYFDRFSQYCATGPAWRHHMLAFLSGSLTTLALPPVGFFPILFIGFPVLLWCLDGAPTKRQAFFLGWWFGFGQFLLGLYWTSFSLLIDIETWWWLIPIAVSCIPAGLAIYTGFVTFFLYATSKKGIRRVVLFAVFWTIAEYLRGHLFTGFPWNLMGYSWIHSLEILQATSVFGIYGLSFFTVLVATLFYLKNLRAATIPLIIIALLWGFGASRLSTPTQQTETIIRIVQPNIPQKEKWIPYLRRKNFLVHTDLTSQTSQHPINAVIWPEVALTFNIWKEPKALELIKNALPKDSLLLTGHHNVKVWDLENDHFEYYNSTLALGPNLEHLGYFDKFHLVPFGEYVPFNDYMFLNKIVGGTANFSSGPGPQTVDLPNLPPFSPLICYEIIFPGAVLDKNNRPEWLLNITNDAWFGKTAGPHQHFSQARIRAIEEGLPVARSANTGISAIIDPYGRVVQHLDLGVRGIIDTPLFKPLDPPLYARYGDVIPFLIMGIFLIAAFIPYKKTAPS